MVLTLSSYLPAHLLTYARYWVCQRVSPKVFEPGTSSAAHEGSGGGGEEANECNRLGENISHFFHSCNRPRPGWYWNCPTNDRYARVCPLTFCCNQWRAARFHPLVAKHTFSPEAAIGAPSSTVLRPSHLPVIRSGLTFAITRRPQRCLVWAGCCSTEGQAACGRCPGVFPALW